MIWNYFQEIILPGAFAEALGRSDVRALFNHDPNHVLGRTKNNTLELAEDETGLAVDILPPDNQFARDLLVSIGRGDIDQMSFAFTVAEDRWYTDENEIPVREISKIDKLYDVSPVTYPAYHETDVSVKSRTSYEEFRASQPQAVGPDVVTEPSSTEAEAEARKRQLELRERSILPMRCKE